ncbi:21222_t:CDS:2, partial [Gigaspora rosea]
LSNCILNHETEMVLENIVQSAIQNDLGVTLSYDGWKNVASQNIIGSTLITADGLSLPWNVEDLSNKHKNWQSVVLMTKNLFNSIEARGILINGLVTDSKALAKQEKTICETNIAQQAQNTDLENKEISDIENKIFNTSEDTDIEELNELNSEDEFKNLDEEKNNQDEINANNELVDNNSLDDDNFFDKDFSNTHPAKNMKQNG